MKKNKSVPLIGILLIVGIVLGIGGYVLYQNKVSPSQRQTINQVQKEVMNNCTYDVDFCKYAANGIVAMSGGYTMTSESTYNGKQSKMIMKSDGKENSESTSFSNGKEEGSFISLNNTTYMKEPGETVWTEFPPVTDETGTPTTNLFDFEGLKKELGDATKNAVDTLTVKKVGTEACGKLSCIVFEMTEKKTNSTTKIWIDNRNFFARKMEMKLKEGTTTMTFEYGPVVITKPSPVKKMPSFDTSLKDSGVNINMDEINNAIKNMPNTDVQETPITE